LNLTITGEGVETREQLMELKALGCDSGQGYYFDRPLSVDAVNEMFSNAGVGQAA
jgi:EAL domain-containing protein (putative c-di-GMP-specific phosphodiesterase class I)